MTTSTRKKPPTDLHSLQFYATPEHGCSYLDNRLARTVFVDPKAQIDLSAYSTLSDLGFRRSGEHIYRPDCSTCSACISVRIPVDLFRLSKSQRRILNRNKDLTISFPYPEDTDEYYQLYEHYIEARHEDGDMYPPSREQFRAFLIQGQQDSRFMEFRLDGQLIAVCVVDHLLQGLSAIYTFFDPDFADRSPGKLAILSLIGRARELQLPYLYLGYWVRGCRKMDYKIAYRPIELLIDGHWAQLARSSLV